MRRLAVLVAFIILVAGCDLSSTPSAAHLRRKAGTQAWVHVIIYNSADPLRPLIARSMRDWSVASRVELREDAACQAGWTCARFRGADMNGGNAGISWGTDKHIIEGWVTVDNRTPIDSQRQNVVCHELGHVLGLSHGNVQGPCQAGHPTAWDLALLDAIHEHAH